MALRAFPLLSAIAGKGDATSARKWSAAYAAWRPLRGGRWTRPRQQHAPLTVESDLLQQGHGPCLDGQTLAHGAHALGGLGLDVHLVQA